MSVLASWAVSASTLTVVHADLNRRGMNMRVWALVTFLAAIRRQEVSAVSHDDC